MDTLMDLGRIDLLVRSGFWREARRRGWFPLVGASAIEYRRPLRVFQRYQLTTRLLGWDERWFYIEQSFRQGEKVAAVATVKAMIRSASGAIPPSDALAVIGASGLSPALPENVALLVRPRPGGRGRRATLLIAKLDRLSRNARFLLGVVEGTGEAGVVFCDLPSVQAGPMGKYIVTNMAAIAELEAGLISQRTRAALSAARARGTKLGNPALRAGSPAMAKAAAAARAAFARERAEFVIPFIDQARKAGATTLSEIAAALHARGIPTATGRSIWYPSQVSRVERYRIHTAEKERD